MKTKHNSSGQITSKYNHYQKSFLTPHPNNQTLLIDTYQQVLNLQLSLIKELNTNKHLIQQFILKDQQINSNLKNKSNQFSSNKINSTLICKNGPLRQNPSCRKIQNRAISDSSSQFELRKVKQIHKKASSGSCYDPQSQNSQKQKIKTIRETKHIPKNYGKAIINFMLRNPQMVQQLCVKHEKNIKQLWKAVDLFKGKIYTVAHLRGMWLQKENKFAAIFRTMSMHYLRRHSLPHIFNSRVENHTRHLKYRYRIIQGVKNPQLFFRIKQY